jgi:hypothetical protein
MKILAKKEVKLNMRKQTAIKLLEFTRNNFDVLLEQWKTGMKMLWSVHTDSKGKKFGVRATLLALGKDAKELFLVSAGLRDYLESLVPGCTLPTLQKYYKPVIIHDDGTVTLAMDAPDEEETPVEETPVEETPVVTPPVEETPVVNP